MATERPTPERNLWREYLDLGDTASNYLAGYVVSYLIRTDPAVVARALDEAKAVSS